MNTDDTVASTLTPPTDTPVDAAPGSDTLWITKEGGNRRMPFDQARLQRTVHSVHAEFPSWTWPITCAACWGRSPGGSNSVPMRWWTC